MIASSLLPLHSPNSSNVDVLLFRMWIGTCQINKRDHSRTRIELNFYRYFSKTRKFDFFSQIAKILSTFNHHIRLANFINVGLLQIFYRAWGLVDLYTYIFLTFASFLSPTCNLTSKINSIPRGLRAEIFFLCATVFRKTRLEVKISKHVPGTRRRARPPEYVYIALSMN